MNTGPLGLCVPSWPGFALQQEGNGSDALRDAWVLYHQKTSHATLYACREGG